VEARRKKKRRESKKKQFVREIVGTNVDAEVSEHVQVIENER
jgi:hypothetical protein